MQGLAQEPLTTRLTDQDHLLLEACITLREALQRLETARRGAPRMTSAQLTDHYRATRCLASEAIELIDRADPAARGVGA